MKFDINKKIANFLSLASKYDKVVLWGFKNSNHSHRYIHLGYFEFLSKLNIECIWVDDNEASNEFISPRSLVMIPDVYLPELKHKFRHDVSYILHQGKNLQDFVIPSANLILLYEYRDIYMQRLSEDESPEQLAPAVAFFPQQRALVQPWGTDLLGSEFFDAVTPSGKDVIFVGTTWGDKEGKKSGNVKILEDIERIVSARELNFQRIQNVSSSENIRLVRSSRLALCPGAIGHAKFGYLQCRVFKNISYGHLSLTDVPRFRDILKDGYIDGMSWEERIDTALGLSEKNYQEKVELQQLAVQNYTYLDMWINMLSLLQR